MHTTHPTQGEPIITHNAEMTQPTPHLPSTSHAESLKAALTPPRTQHITTNKRIYKTRKPHCELNLLYAGIFLTARLPQQNLTLMASQMSSRHSAKDISTEQTSLMRLECSHTGLTRKTHCLLKSLYAGIFLMASLPQQNLTLMATQMSTQHLAKESSTQQTSFRRLESGHTFQTRKPHCELNSVYAGIFLMARLRQQSLTLMFT